MVSGQSLPTFFRPNLPLKLVIPKRANTSNRLSTTTCLEKPNPKLANTPNLIGKPELLSVILFSFFSFSFFSVFLFLFLFTGEVKMTNLILLLSHRTKITFKPDFEKFGMDGLDADMVALFKKRVYDIAGTSPKDLKVRFSFKPKYCLRLVNIGCCYYNRSSSTGSVSK